MHRWAMYGGAGVGAGVQMGILVFISHLDVTTASSSVLLLYLQTFTNGISIFYNPFQLNISTKAVFNLIYVHDALY